MNLIKLLYVFKEKKCFAFLIVTTFYIFVFNFSWQFPSLTSIGHLSPTE